MLSRPANAVGSFEIPSLRWANEALLLMPQGKSQMQLSSQRERGSRINGDFAWSELYILFLPPSAVWVETKPLRSPQTLETCWFSDSNRYLHGLQDSKFFCPHSLCPWAGEHAISAAAYLFGRLCIVRSKHMLFLAIVLCEY